MWALGPYETLQVMPQVKTTHLTMMCCSIYEEWETDKRSKGEIRDINGEGECQQDTSTANEQNLEREA
jgi:hypothetical protein